MNTSVTCAHGLAERLWSDYIADSNHSNFAWPALIWGVGCENATLIPDDTDSGGQCRVMAAANEGEPPWATSWWPWFLGLTAFPPHLLMLRKCRWSSRGRDSAFSTSLSAFFRLLPHLPHPALLIIVRPDGYWSLSSSEPRLSGHCNHLNPCATSTLWNIKTLKANLVDQCRSARRPGLWHSSVPNKPLIKAYRCCFFSLTNPRPVIGTQLHVTTSLLAHGCGCSRRKIKAKCLISWGGRWMNEERLRNLQLSSTSQRCIMTILSWNRKFHNEQKRERKSDLSPAAGTMRR